MREQSVRLLFALASTEGDPRLGNERSPGDDTD